MNTVKQMRADLLMKREELKDLIQATKNIRAHLKNLRTDIRREVQINRVVKEDQRRLVREARAAKKAERNALRIQKLEAKLLALKSPKAVRKANQKASAAKVYSAGAANAALNRANWIAATNTAKGVA